MAKYTIEEKTLKDIADSIRSKTGSTEAINPINMASAIERITTGENYDILENVEVNLDLTDGDQAISVPDGSLVKSAIIKKPNTLIPENIAEGIDIAGVVGTFEGGSGNSDESIENINYMLDEINGECVGEVMLGRGSCGYSATYTLRDDGILRISGEGEVTSAPWLDLPDYQTIIDEIIINNGITSVCAYAFKGCANLTDIIIPKSLTSIGEAAFLGCSSLSSITIPDSVTNIGNNVFEDCQSLTNVEIPDSVTNSSLFGTFVRCTSLVNVTIPKSVTMLYGTFIGCTKLVNIVIPDSVTNIFGAFSDCASLQNIVIPNSVAAIGNTTFSGCVKLTDITIGNGVAIIDANAFVTCTSLNSATLKRTTGWHVENSNELLELDSSQLTNPTAVASYLCSNYCEYTWKNTEVAS